MTIADRMRGIIILQKIISRQILAKMVNFTEIT
jgi:hypothetical protein